MDGAENRLTAAEQNAQRLSGQLEELAAVANTARGGGQAAQETADQALAASKANSAEIQATNDRISQIDNYEAKQNIAVNFRVNSAVLAEAKAALDEIAAQAKNEKGYLIQVTGYASADGRRRKPRAQRAPRRSRETVSCRESRRPAPPHGQPVRIRRTEARGRKRHARRPQTNRRVEVAILVSKGLAASGVATSNVSSQ